MSEHGRDPSGEIGTRRPLLLALQGLPGSGKSAAGRELGRRLGWPLIDKDDIQDALVRDAGLAVESVAGAAYLVMWALARRQLLQGLSVICDSPLAHRWSYESARHVAEAAGATLAILECRCNDEALWRRRIEARLAAGELSHRITTWDGLLAYRERVAPDLAVPMPAPRLAIDMARPQDAIVAEASAWLTNLDA